MRELAPIPTSETVIDLLRESVSNHTFFEYRMKATQRKHLAVDVQSANAIVTVYDALNDANKAKFTSIAPNVGNMAIMAWKCFK